MQTFPQASKICDVPVVTMGLRLDFPRLPAIWEAWGEPCFREKETLKQLGKTFKEAGIFL